MAKPKKGPGPGRKPASVAERNARKREVGRRLKELQPHHQITHELSEMYGIREVEVRPLIREVYEDWQLGRAEAWEPHQTEALLSGFQEIAHRAVQGVGLEKGPDYKAAIQALDRVGKIRGVFAPEEKYIKHHVEASNTLRDPQVMAERLVELLQKPQIAAQLEAMGLRVTIEKI